MLRTFAYSSRISRRHPISSRNQVQARLIDAGLSMTTEKRFSFDENIG